MKAILVGILVLTAFSFGYIQSNKEAMVKEDSLAKNLYKLGMEKPSHFLNKIEESEVQKGYDLVHFGRTMHEGKKSKYISKYYKCTSCHNTVREDRNLTVVNTNDRLNYAIENNIPYLQGSTFWGIVNRSSWYNDDYVKKYGDLVEKAKNSLEESTQLCAKVCSQGRPLEDWEMKAILSYYWSLELKLNDLNLDFDHLNSLSNSAQLEYLKEHFLDKSPATFADPISDKSKGYDLAGNPENGEKIYELSCQHCHREGGESDVVLDKGRSTFKWLRNNIEKDSELSIYEIIRKGTYSEKGHREYMPNYTLEKMSDQQIEDLRAYIEKMAS